MADRKTHLKSAEAFEPKRGKRFSCQGNCQMDNYIHVQALAAISENFSEYLRPYVQQLIAQGILTAEDFQALPATPANKPKEEAEPKKREYAQSFPGGLTTDFLLDHRTLRIINSKASDLVRTGLFPPYEEEDLREDIRLDLWSKMPKYDPSQLNADPYKFAGSVVANYGKNLLNRRNYEIANGRPTVSLSEMANEDETIGDQIAEDQGGPLCGCSMPSVRLQEMREAVSYFLTTLKPLPQAISVLLLLGFSNRAIAKKFRRTERMIRKIIASELLPAAIDAGLDDFVGGAR